MDGVINMAKMAFDNDENRVNVVRTVAEDCKSLTDGDRCELAIKVMGCAEKSARDKNIDFHEIM